MQIIDCHIHPATAGDYHANITDLVRRMQRHNIAKAVISDLGDWSAYPDEDTLIAANERVRRESLASDGRLEYLVYINPQLPDWRSIFDRFYPDACGVKLWISLRKKGGSLDAAKEVLRLAAKCGLPVLIHTFDRTVSAHPGEIGVAEIIELAGAVPGCLIVAAHSGGNWRKAVARAGEFPENVVFDISGTYPERTMVRRLVDAFSSERILYGSDAYGRSFGAQLSKLHDCGLSKTELENILFLNARRVFRLSDIKPCQPEKLPVWNISDDNADNFCFTGKSEYWDHFATPEMLVGAAKRYGVDTLYAASLEALTASDRCRANLLHRAECSAYPQIKPLAVADLRDMAGAMETVENTDGFAGVLISPYLHNYQLSYCDFAEFFDTCSKRDIPIWINTVLGDDRFRDPRLETRVVKDDEIISFASQAPVCRYTIQGTVCSPALSRALPCCFKLECSGLFDWEYAPDDTFRDGVPERLVYGSGYPFREYGCVKRLTGSCS